MIANANQTISERYKAPKSYPIVNRVIESPDECGVSGWVRASACESEIISTAMIHDKTELVDIEMIEELVSEIIMMHTYLLHNFTLHAQELTGTTGDNHKLNHPCFTERLEAACLIYDQPNTHPVPTRFGRFSAFVDSIESDRHELAECHRELRKVHDSLIEGLGVIEELDKQLEALPSNLRIAKKNAKVL